MVTYFVDSVSGLSTNNGTSWANAYDKLATAIAGAGGSAAMAIGDTVFVGDDHNETTAAAISLSFPTSTSNFSRILCADHTVASPGPGDLKTTGQVSTTGASNITIGGSSYFYGLTFNAGSAANTANINCSNTSTGSNTFQSCTFVLNNTSTTSRIQTGLGTSCSTTWYGCSVQLGSANQSITAGTGYFMWKNSSSSFLGANLPAAVLGAGGTGAVALIDGVDFTAMSGKALMFVNVGPAKFTYKDCLLPSSFTGADFTQSGRAVNEVNLIRSDASGAGNLYRVEHGTNATMVTETTIVRTGGASDGTISFSRKISTTSNWVDWGAHFYEMPPIATWNAQTGTRTVTIHATSNLAAGAFPNNDDIWIEVTYLGSATTPISSFANNTKATILSSNSAYTSDGATWGGSAAGGTFAMAVTVTVGQIGYIYVTVKIAKQSTIFYVDPLIVLS